MGMRKVVTRQLASRFATLANESSKPRANEFEYLRTVARHAQSSRRQPLTPQLHSCGSLWPAVRSPRHLVMARTRTDHVTHRPHD